MECGNASCRFPSWRNLKRQLALPHSTLDNPERKRLRLRVQSSVRESMQRSDIRASVHLRASARERLHALAALDALVRRVRE